MKSRWDDAEAADFPGSLGERVYSSRLLGRDPALVMHGGGNTSVKLRQPDLWQAEEDLLYVKISGCDLATIDATGFTALRLARLRALARLDQLSDTAMARELRVAAADPDKSAPSVEAILHAILPHRYVDHTHAGAALILANTPSGEEHVRRAYGDLAIVVPYVRSGFELARLCARLAGEWLTESTIGLVLLNHGLISFGETARESYERMIALVTRGEDYLAERGVGEPALAVPRPAEHPPPGRELAQLRGRISAAAGFPVIVRRDNDPLGVSFARRPDLETLSQAGPATPDHAIRTKRVPLLGRDVEDYAAAYRDYFQAYAGRHPGPPLTMLDPAPRVVLDTALGLCTAGRAAADAEATADIYKHTIELILRASELERWQPLPPEEIFAVEYWAAEQAKLKLDRQPPEFAGEVLVVSGAASGIGRACAAEFLARGAAVCGLDVNPDITSAFTGPDYLGLACDVTCEDAVAAALESCALRFGGVDMLVLSAGIFPSSRRIGELGLDEWRRTFAVNTDACLLLMRLAAPFLELAPRGGRVVVIASKNVPAPGPGAAAYSASKAAVTQLARVAALEWGGARIRVNTLHPNAVFDTGIWTDEVIAARAAQYGLTPAEYRTRNVLGVEVTSGDVAALAAAMCGSAFAKTTGAQVPVDGGNDRVI
jgi:rhamnose utilization protein RhaD (predicted bifunctional aldolase and dehydrogenase)/NAD(P)-dependent dehydrogenase (short-subunit alcohol dehydrogenase family)